MAVQFTTYNGTSGLVFTLKDPEDSSDVSFYMEYRKVGDNLEIVSTANHMIKHIQDQDDIVAMIWFAEFFTIVGRNPVDHIEFGNFILNILQHPESAGWMDLSVQQYRAMLASQT